MKKLLPFIALLLLVSCGSNPTATSDPTAKESDNSKITISDTLFCTIEIDSLTKIVFTKREIWPGYEAGSVDTFYGAPILLKGTQSFDIQKYNLDYCGFTPEYYISPDHQKILLPFLDCGWVDGGDTLYWHEHISFYLIDTHIDKPFLDPVYWDEDRFGNFEMGLNAKEWK